MAHCRRRQDFFDAWERGELRELCSGMVPDNERSAPCRHRGDEVRQVACATCRGQVRLKVFTCGLFGECLPGRAVDSLPSCAVCSRYELESSEVG